MYNKIKKITRYGAIIAIFLGFIIAGTTFFKANGQVGVFWTKEKGFEYAYDQELWTTGKGTFENIKDFDININDVYVEFSPQDRKDVAVEYGFIGTESDIKLEQRGTKLSISQKREPKERFLFGALGMTYQEVNRVHHNPYITVGSGINPEAATQNEKITIKYPQKMDVNTMKLEITSGDINLQGMNIKNNSSIYTISGNITLMDVKGSTLNLGVGNGNTHLSNTTIDSELVVHSDTVESGSLLYSNGSLTIEDSKINKINTDNYVGYASITGIETTSDLKFASSNQLMLSDIKAKSLTVEPTYYADINITNATISENISIISEEGNNDVTFENVQAKNLQLTTGNLNVRLANSKFAEKVVIAAQSYSDINFENLEIDTLDMENVASSEITITGSEIGAATFAQESTISTQQSTFKTIAGRASNFQGLELKVTENFEMELENSGELRIEDGELKALDLKGDYATVSIYTTKIDGSNIHILSGDISLDNIDLINEHQISTENAEVIVGFQSLKKEHVLNLTTDSGTLSVFDEQLDSDDVDGSGSTFENKVKSKDKLTVTSNTSDIIIR